MSGVDHLISELLFAVLPRNQASPGPLTDYLYVRQALFLELLDSTYFALREGEFVSEKDGLTIWEIRILLLLFSDQLPLAKREAVLLNNALYLHESPGAARLPLSKQAGVSATDIHKSSQHSYGTSYHNLQHDKQQQKTQPPVFPLPSNTEGKIPDFLVTLLLSLKTAPNLTRVNEIYRLCYQKRLKGGANGETDAGLSRTHLGVEVGLQAKLMALSYGVIAVLFVSRNYATLVSFLTSLRHDLQLTISSRKKKSGIVESTDDYESYYSNVTLVWVLAKIHARRAYAALCGHETWGPLYAEQLAEVGAHTYKSLAGVTGKIAPRLGGPTSLISSTPDAGSVSELAAFVADDQLSLRTICCLLAFWSISATHSADLTENKRTMESEERSTDLGRVHDFIRGEWRNYFNKLYGLE